MYCNAINLLLLNAHYQFSVALKVKTAETSTPEYRKNSKYWDTQTSYRSCP